MIEREATMEQKQGQSTKCISTPKWRQRQMRRMATQKQSGRRRNRARKENRLKNSKGLWMETEDLINTGNFLRVA